MKIKSIIKTILCFITAAAGTVISLIFCRKSSTQSTSQEADREAEKRKKETYEKLETTDGSDLVDGSVNAAEYYGRIDAVKDEFRNRVRNRFNKIL